MKNRSTICAAILLALGYFALRAAPNAFGVVPAPDGGYPGGNTAEGQNALFGLTTGGFNTAVGYLSLRSNTTGSFNTAVGAGALLANTGNQNTAIGIGALLSNTTGGDNTATGAFALLNNTSDANTATGARALQGNTTGDQNTATGADALFHNTSGPSNTATGVSALDGNTTGAANTATGIDALGANNGDFNTADGAFALNNNFSGNNNTASGYGALRNSNTGSNNIALGYNAGINVTTANHVICIGADGNDVNNACFIGQIFGETSANGTAVFVNSNGRLGTATSSRRFKEEIKPMDKASEALFALKPVAFRYKKEIDPAGTSQFGLVAEEVENVNPDLVVRDKEGKPYSVRYDQVNAMLLNEFLKEHRKVEQQEATIERLRTNLRVAVAQLGARLEAQESQLQKVSAQLEASKAAPNVVLNNR